jgi:hypothetical protein
MNDSQEPRDDRRAQLRDQLAQRNRQLQEIAAQLKTELFGIDPIIDRVIDSVRAWVLLPELVSRPVIVCLWGLTGTGKTQLVRRLAQLLGFYDRFVEVQMDGFSNGAGWRGPTRAACSSSSAATSTRCTRTWPPAWTTATAMPTCFTD